MAKKSLWFSAAAAVCAVLILASTSLNAAGSCIKPGSLDEALKKAKECKKLVLAEYYDATCGYCRRMDKTVLCKSTVAAAVGKFVAVRINAGDEAFEEKYSPVKSPTYYVLKCDGTVAQKMEGVRPANVFTVELENAIAKSEGRPTKPIPKTKQRIGGG